MSWTVPTRWTSWFEPCRTGVTGVPTFVFANRYAVAGAQPVEVYERMLRRAREVS